MLSSRCVNRGKWFVGGSLLALGLALSSQAGAQQLESMYNNMDSLGAAPNVGRIPTPSVASSVDEFGVDMASGAFMAVQTDLSIGSGSSGLSRSQGSFVTPYTDNFTGGVNLSSSGTGNLKVTIGNSSEEFKPNGSGGWTPVFGSPSTLNCDGSQCTYTTADGTVAVFTRDLIFPDYSVNRGQINSHGVLTQITRPDGEVITLTYRGASGDDDTYRVRHVHTVTSSLGWKLKYHVENDDSRNFRPTRVDILNASIDNCTVSANNCEETSTLRSLTIGTGTNATITDPLNNTITYNAAPVVTSVVMPSGATKSLGYTNGRVSSVTISGSTWTYTTSQSGNTFTATRTDPAGKTRVLTYDSSNSRLVSVKDENNDTTKYEYTAEGRVYRVIPPWATYSGSTLTGGYTQYGYNGNGNVTSVSQVPRFGGSALTTTAAYPTSGCNAKTCNQPTSITDAAGVTTTYTYSTAHGGVETVTLPAVNGVSPQTRYSYAPFTPSLKTGTGTWTNQPQVYRLTGISACMTGSAGGGCVNTSDERRTIIAYGGNNVLATSVTVRRGDGAYSQTTNFTYDNFGNVTIADGPKSGTDDAAYFFYDELNRRIGSIGADPDGGGGLPRPAERIYYDGDGRAWKTQTGYASGTSRWHLDTMAVKHEDTTEFETASGLPKIARQYDEGVLKRLLQVSYDSRLRTDCVADRLDLTAQTSACTLSTSGNRLLKYSYDDVGRVTELVSGYGSSNARIEQSNHYLWGILNQTSDGNGNTTKYVYDNFYRPTQVCYPNKYNGYQINYSDCQTTEYNPSQYNGARVTKVTLRDGQQVNFGYDAIGRVSSQSGSFSASFAYNNFGQTTSHTRNGFTHSYGYNAMGWLESDGQPLGTVSYEYDWLGRRTKMTYPGSGLYLSYVYDQADRLTRICENTDATSCASGSPVVWFDYDDQGRRSHIYRANGQTTIYGYDARSRLSSLTLPGNTQTYTYTHADQVLTQANTDPAYTYSPTMEYVAFGVNDLNQIASATQSGSTSTITYDNRGNLTSDGGASYDYNAYNGLTSYTPNVGAGVTLAYDAENRIHSLNQTGTWTKFLYGLNGEIIAEYNGSNQVIRRYLHGPGSDEPLVWYEGSGSGDRRYLHADRLGSIVATTDNGGNRINVSTYDAYGLKSHSNVAYASRFQFTGQAYLSEIGLYYYKARMYHPRIGRFLQPDPIGYADGLNMYAYVGNDPVNMVDSTGLFQDCITRKVLVAVPEKSVADGGEPQEGGAVFTYVEETICRYPMRDYIGEEFMGYMKDFAELLDDVYNGGRDYNPRGCSATREEAEENLQKFYKDETIKAAEKFFMTALGDEGATVGEDAAKAGRAIAGAKVAVKQSARAGTVAYSAYRAAGNYKIGTGARLQNDVYSHYFNQQQSGCK